MNMIQSAVATVRSVFQSRHGMPDHEAAEWAETTTMPELCGMNVRWFNGELAATVFESIRLRYTARMDVDEDVAPGITDALIALNLAGFLTENSQAGCAEYIYDLPHREALVTGYADDATFEWLMDVVQGTPYRIWAWPPADGLSGSRLGTPVGDQPNDGGWAGMSEEELVWMFSVCSEQAINVVCSAWQVTIYDPEPIRNDMWEHLRQAAEVRR